MPAYSAMLYIFYIQNMQNESTVSFAREVPIWGQGARTRNGVWRRISRYVEHADCVAMPGSMLCARRTPCATRARETKAFDCFLDLSCRAYVCALRRGRHRSRSVSDAPLAVSSALVMVQACTGSTLESLARILIRSRAPRHCVEVDARAALKIAFRRPVVCRERDGNALRHQSAAAKQLRTRSYRHRPERCVRRECVLLSLDCPGMPNAASAPLACDSRVTAYIIQMQQDVIQ